MEMRQIRYFVAVAEAGSFRRAAETLRVAQPAVSRQIAALEEEIGASLFEDGSRRRVLSAAGEAFLEDARALLAGAERAVARAQSVGRGEYARLRIAFTEIASDSEMIAAFLTALRKAMPSVEIAMLPMPSTHQIEALLRKRIDAGFLVQVPDLDKRISFHGLTDHPVMAVMPRSHPLARRVKLSRRDLEGQRLLLVSRAIRPDFYEAVMETFRSAAQPPHLEEVASAATAASLASVGMGIGLLMSMMKARLPEGLVMRPFADMPLVFRLGLAWCPAHDNPYIARMVEVARKQK